jgi:hypothetical protein
MKIHFDEHTLREIGRKYDTHVIMTDYVDHMDVYSGPLNQNCFNMIKFYLSNHWLDGCTWHKKEEHLRTGWTKLVTEAVDEKGEELFNITVVIKDKVDVSRVGEEPVKIGKGTAFFLGLTAGFFPVEKALEVVGAGWLLGQVTKRKED